MHTILTYANEKSNTFFSSTASDVKRSMADVNSFVKKGSSDDVFE